MSTPSSDRAFIDALRAFVDSRERHSDNRTLNVLISMLGALRRYYGFLDIIVDRYASRSSDFVASMAAWHETLEHGGSGSGSMSDSDWQAIQEHARQSTYLHLEIESFYVFANILLDRTASTVRWYFWRKPSWNQRQILTNLRTIITKRRMILEPADLVERLEHIDRLIVMYRNKRIEHAAVPRLFFGTAWSGRGDVRIAPFLLYPEQADVKNEQYTTTDLNDLMVAMDSYLSGIVTFLDANSAQSVLPIS